MINFKKRFKVFLVFLVLIYCGVSSFAFANEIWCNPANEGQENGTTKATGFKTLHAALSAMSSGDTVIIANGDWRNTSGMYINVNNKPPDGTDGRYSRVIAETDWGVKIPSIHIERPLPDTYGYLEVRGIVFDNKYIKTGIDHISYHLHHTKFIRCGFIAHGLEGNSHTCGFGSADSSKSINQYNLMEECIAWGSGRYVFYDKFGKYNVFRRCIARHDLLEGATQFANFRAYACDYTSYQNCISIDSDRVQYYNSGNVNDETAGYWAGDQYGGIGNEIVGCISIKDMHLPYYFGGVGTGNASINNSIALDPVPGYTTLSAFILAQATDLTASNILGFKGLGEGQDGFYHKKSGSLSIRNSIVKDVNDYGLWVTNATNINHYNAGKCYSSWGTNATSYDPEENGLLYPVRIEAGSKLATAGENGEICGPTILKKIGVLGTLYGEPGWDTVTDENLWPFPNEDKIKELMSESVEADIKDENGNIIKHISSTEMGDYGFTAKNATSLDGSPQTLTKYIWEYLGNKIPSDVYNNASQETAPGVPSKFDIKEETK